MITDAERKAALLALQILQINIAGINPRADGNYAAEDLTWAINESIIDLEKDSSDLEELFKS